MVRYKYREKHSCIRSKQILNNLNNSGQRKLFSSDNSCSILIGAPIVSCSSALAKQRLWTRMTTLTRPRTWLWYNCPDGCSLSVAAGVDGSRHLFCHCLYSSNWCICGGRRWSWWIWQHRRILFFERWRLWLVWLWIWLWLSITVHRWLISLDKCTRYKNIFSLLKYVSPLIVALWIPFAESLQLVMGRHDTSSKREPLSLI